MSLILACLLASCTFEDQAIPNGENGTDAFGLSRDGSAEELFFEALQLQSQGLITAERMESMRRQMEVADEVYAQDADHEVLLRNAIWSQLKLSAAEVRREDRPIVEALEGRAYARRMHQAGQKAARQGAAGVVWIAGMLGVPTSKEEALLMVAIPVGGYLLVKVSGMTLKRAAFLFRHYQRADEVVERASELGFKVQRVADSDTPRTAIAKEDAALAEQLDEVLERIPQTESKHAAGSSAAPIASTRNVEVRSQLSPALEIQSQRNVEVRSQVSPASTAEMSSRPRTPPPNVAPPGSTPIRNVHLAGKKHPVTGVPFDLDGYPDFRAAGVVHVEVKITYTGSRMGDYAAANKAAGLRETPKGMTWHHHQDGTSMQLVPTDIHAKTGHTGGFSGGP